MAADPHAGLYGPPPAEDTPPASDYARSFGAGALDTGADLAASLRYHTDDATSPLGELTNSMAKILQRDLGDAGESVNEDISPAAREKISASVTSPKFWSLSAAGLKAAGMLPGVAAMSLGAVATSFTGHPELGVAGASAAMSEGAFLKRVYKAIDDKPDQELRETNPWYANLRDMGMDEQSARRDLLKKVTDGRAQLNAAIGAIAGVVGPVGAVARGSVVGAAESGVLARTGIAAGENAGAMALQSGVGENTGQRAEMDVNPKQPYDQSRIVDAVLTGGVTGAALGAVTGPFAGHGAKAGGEKLPEAAPRPDVKVEVVDPAGPTAEQKVALEASNPPPEPAKPQAAREVPAPVEEASRRVATPPENIPEVQPEPVTPQVTDVPPPVAEASKRVSLPEPARTDQVAAPEEAVPPAVSEASKRASEPVAATVAGVTPEEPRAPRILRPTDEVEKAAVRLSKAAQDAAQPRLTEDTAPGGKNWTKAELAQRDNDAVESKKIFDKYAPDATQVPKDLVERNALRERLQEILKAAEAVGIKIPAKVGYDGTSDHMVWLREVKTLAAAMSKKSFVGTKATDHMVSFLGREKAAKGGDFSVMRGERKTEGELAKRVSQGDVETMSASGPDVEKDQVVTVAPKSAKGSVRGVAAPVDEARTITLKTGEKVAAAKAASAPKKIEITPELRAKYETVTARVTPEPAPKLAPKVVEVKARVEAAARKVNTEPTEAQKESGTYEKGHVSIQGIPVTIENPRGSERSGKGPDGKPWKVTLPDHYGYVKRTEGADGDQVDVYVGKHPDSKHVFVVDQHDLKTGKFDEHKALLGYNDAVTALHAYEKSFSDGKGLDRIGKITPMTVDEFKAWLAKGDTKAPAADAAAEPVTSPIRPRVRDFTDDELRKVFRDHHESLGIEPIQTLSSLTGAGHVPVLHTESAASVLKSLKIGDFEGISAKMYPLVRARLMQLVPDVPVHFVTQAGMRALTAGHRSPAMERAWAYHQFDPATGHEYVAVDATKLADPKTAAWVATHELVHAATVRALREDLRTGGVITNHINRLMAEVLENNVFVRRGEHGDYGMTNPYEFLAEAFSNPEFQQKLAETRVSDETAQRLGLDKWKENSIWNAVVEVVRWLMKLPPTAHTALGAALRIGDLVMDKNVKVRAERALGDEIAGLRKEAPTTSALKVFDRDVGEVFTRAARQEQVGSPKLLKIHTWDQIAQIADRYFGGNNPVRRLVDAREMRRVAAAKLLDQSDPIVAKAATLERKYTGDVWDNFVSVVHDETNAGVWADRKIEDQPHLKSDTADNAYSKAKHADLAERYAKIPEDLRALRREGHEYFAAQQNKMSFDNLKNRMKLEGVEDDAMARRIFDDKETPADVKAVGGERVMDLIKESGDLKKIVGPYYPLMRHGDWVVSGRYKTEAPKNAIRELTDKSDPSAAPTFEFKTREEATAFGGKQHARPTVRSVWVDKTTGERYGVEKDGTEVKITKEDTNAEQRWRVAVQDWHVDMFDTQKAALEAAHELEHPSDGSASMFREVHGVEQKRYEPGGRAPDILSGQLRTMMEGVKKRKSFDDFSDAQKNELVQAMSEARIRMLGSTRIQSKSLPRRYVAGASRDFTRVMRDYATSSSAYIAKMEYAPVIEQAMKEIRDSRHDDYAKETSVGRSVIANELDRRMAKDNIWENHKLAGAAQRLLTLSFIDKLASPATSVINALQTAMVGMPVIAGRHGVARTTIELSKAYNDIAGLSIIKQGLREVGRKAAGDVSSPDYVGGIKSRLNAGERKMLEYIEARGSIGGDSSLEIPRLLKARAGDTLSSKVGAAADTALGYLEGIVRQMPAAVESINRGSVALAAYRLELFRTGSHDKATSYAHEVVNNTQFNYSNTNAPPVFNHPLAKLSLQFKKYGQAMYYLIGSNIGKAYRGDKPGERAEALKTLGLLAVTSMSAAGALGLPTEPFKYLLMGAKAAGLTSTGWDDVEEAVRAHAADIMGKTASEIFSRGLPRALGIDTSSRMGLDSLVTFGSPKSDKKNDVEAYLWESLAGAPVSLIADYIRGANLLAQGEFVKAAELMVPIKLASDSIRAYRQGTEGKKAATGRTLSEPYSGPEMAARVFGFTPAREAEEGAKAAAFHSQSTKASETRSGLINNWINAKGSDKAKAFAAVQAYNRTSGKESKIMPKDLTGAAKRREDQGMGPVTNKRTQPILDRLEQVYR